MAIMCLVHRTCLVRGGSSFTPEMAGFLMFCDPSPSKLISVPNSTGLRAPAWWPHEGDGGSSMVRCPVNVNATPPPRSVRCSTPPEGERAQTVPAQAFKVLINSPSSSAIACTPAWVGGLETAPIRRSLNAQPSTSLLNWPRISPETNVQLSDATLGSG